MRSDYKDVTHPMEFDGRVDRFNTIVHGIEIDVPKSFQVWPCHCLGDPDLAGEIMADGVNECFLVTVIYGDTDVSGIIAPADAVYDGRLEEAYYLCGQEPPEILPGVPVNRQMASI